MFLKLLCRCLSTCLLRPLPLLAIAAALTASPVTALAESAKKHAKATKPIGTITPANKRHQREKRAAKSLAGKAHAAKPRTVATKPFATQARRAAPATPPVPRKAVLARRSLDPSELRFSGNEMIDDEELRQALGATTGGGFRSTEVDRLSAQIGEYYRRRGYRAHAYPRPESLATGAVEFVVVEAADQLRHDRAGLPSGFLAVRAGQVALAEPRLRIDAGLGRFTTTGGIASANATP